MTTIGIILLATIMFIMVIATLALLNVCRCALLASKAWFFRLHTEKNYLLQMKMAAGSRSYHAVIGLEEIEELKNEADLLEFYIIKECSNPTELARIAGKLEDISMQSLAIVDRTLNEIRNAYQNASKGN